MDADFRRQENVSLKAREYEMTREHMKGEQTLWYRVEKERKKRI